MNAPASRSALQNPMNSDLDDNLITISHMFDCCFSQELIRGKLEKFEVTKVLASLRSVKIIKS